MCTISSLADLSPQLANAMKKLWADSGVQKCFRRSTEYKHFGLDMLSDAAPYFLNSLNRICAVGYVPNRDDVLHTRNLTQGTNEFQFVLEGVRIRYDFERQ